MPHSLAVEIEILLTVSLFLCALLFMSQSVLVQLLKQVQERVSVTWFNTFSEKIISYRESESRRLINEKCK